MNRTVEIFVLVQVVIVCDSKLQNATLWYGIINDPAKNPLLIAVRLFNNIYCVVESNSKGIGTVLGVEAFDGGGGIRDRASQADRSSQECWITFLFACFTTIF